MFLGSFQGRRRENLVDQKKAKRILAEIARRQLLKPDWKGVCFEKQWDFINDPSSFKAVQCTRRAGKSYSAGIYAFKEAFETPGCSIVILGLTRDSVKRIFYKDILKELDESSTLRPNSMARTSQLHCPMAVLSICLVSMPTQMT